MTLLRLDIIWSIAKTRVIVKNITTRVRKISLIASAFVLLFLLFVPSADSDVLKAEIQDDLNSGDTAKAITLLEQEIKLDPAFHYNYYVLGRIYYNWMQFDKALGYFKSALDKKKHLESLYHFGLCNIKVEDLKEAQRAMEDGLKKAPKELKHLFENGIGMVYLAIKDYPEADRSFRRALALSPNNPEYHINLGDANFYQGIPALAVMEYENAMKADTASLEVYYHWAEACLELKDYQCAIDKLKIVLEKDSTHAPAWMRAGSIYYKAARSASVREDQVNRFKDAIGSYNKYIQLSGAKPDSSTVRAYYDLAMSYFGLNGFEEAVKYFESVLSIPYEPRDVYFYYGKTLWGNRDYVRSGEMFQKHLEWVGKQGTDYQSTASLEEINKLLGDSYFFRKPRDLNNALVWYNKSLEINPNQKRVLETLAIAYHTNKSYAQALEFYKRRIELGIDSASADILKNAGFCALNLANAGEGGEDLELDLEEDMSNGEVIEPAESTSTEPAEDYYKLAIGYLNEFSKFNISDAKVVALVANTYLYQMQNCANGIEWFEKLLILEPANCDAKKALGFAYFGGLCNKNYSKALGYLREAYFCVVNTAGACSDSEIAMWVAQCYHLQGADKIKAKESAAEEFKNAYDWYGKVLECQPANANAKKGRDDLKFEF